MSNNFTDIEVMSVERKTLTESPHKKIRFLHPLTILFTHRKDWVAGDVYWQAEIEDLMNDKLFYIGSGETREEAERDLFNHIALIKKIQEDLDELVTSPFSRKMINERQAIFRKHIAYVN